MLPYGPDAFPARPRVPPGPKGAPRRMTEPTRPERENRRPRPEHRGGVRSNRGRRRRGFLTRRLGDPWICAIQRPVLEMPAALNPSWLRSWCGPRDVRGYRGRSDRGSARDGRRDGGRSLGIARLGSRRLTDLGFGDRRPSRAGRSCRARPPLPSRPGRTPTYRSRTDRTRVRSPDRYG